VTSSADHVRGIYQELMAAQSWGGLPPEGEEFLKTAAVTRKDRDTALWQTWKDSGKDPTHLDPLLDAYQPLVAMKMREWRAPAIPPAAFQAELHGQLIRAFDTYNPSRGTALATHVHHRIQKAKRYMNQYQNIGYIPENKSRHIGELLRAQSMLNEDLGRDPTPQELSDHLGMSVKRVTQVQQSMRRDVPSSALESDPTTMANNPRMAEVLDLLPHSLSPDERQVFDHIYGRNGKQQITSTGALAKALGKSPSQISRIRSSIAQQFRNNL
jgi:DNA-directed RNA polymerase specialized sigma subunit